MDILKRVGKNIKVSRAIKGMSQDNLADAANISRTYISSIETGKKAMSIVVLHQIARALDTPIADLLSGCK